jgi:hypothetical protein
MTFSPEEIEKRYRLLPCISLSWIKRLKALGVTVDALCEPDFPASGHVVFFDGSRFEFVADAHGGEAFEAMLLLALDEFGEVCDIVAYDPRTQAQRILARQRAFVGPGAGLAPQARSARGTNGLR